MVEVLEEGFDGFVLLDVAGVFALEVVLEVVVYGGSLNNHNPECNWSKRVIGRLQETKAVGEGGLVVTVPGL